MLAVKVDRGEENRVGREDDEEERKWMGGRVAATRQGVRRGTEFRACSALSPSAATAAAAATAGC